MEAPLGLMIEPAQRVASEAALAWRRATTTLLGRPLAAWRDETRAALGLPTDRPLVLTGHQAQVWHAGILAKWFVADREAEALSGDAVQLVVDQDINDAGLVPYPGERDGALLAAQLPTTPAHQRGPTALQSPVRCGAPEAPPVAEAADGLASIVAALDGAADGAPPNAARQLARANDTLLAPFVKPFHAVYATQFLATPLGIALRAEMARDAAACATAYNAALANDPHGARPLDVERGELPLWTLHPNGRERVHAGASAAKGETPDALVAPRAFLMTAFARLVLCDLFIHGTGGARYERVTEAWIRSWLGVDLAPMCVATATLRLPLERFVGDDPVATAADLRRLEWDPDSEGAAPSPEKQAYLEKISQLPRGTPERRAAYRGMLDHLTERCAAQSTKINHVAALARDSRDRAVIVELASNRTWPWPLHGKAAILRLRDAVRGECAAR